MNNHTSASPAPTRPRVVLIGCGFGGLEAVRLLSSAPVDITLVDRTNHHLFQPLLYQVATANVSAPAVSGPIRHILRREMRRGNLTVLQAEVTRIDATRRELLLDQGQALPYDHLIVAAGATHSYFGHDEWQPVAPGLKTLADAFNIRARIIGAFERAELCADTAQAQQWLNFVVIGGGPTGVELAGALVEIARHTLPDEFRRIDSRRARVVLVEGSDRVLGAFHPRLSESARRQLEKLGVEVRTGCRVTGIDHHGVTYHDAAHPEQGDQRIEARTVLWGAGVAASPLGRSLAETAGATLDRAGRVVVEADLTVPGHPEISVIGDLAAAKSHGKSDPKPVPGVSPAAKQMGRLAARNLLRRLRGEPAVAFRYLDYGSLATIGRKSAVVQLEVPAIGEVKWGGYFAWLFWLFAHVYFLIGFRNRLIVLFDWAWSYWTFERHARVVAESAQEPKDAPA
ncbi:NAD(P)/FAD-dependent oxidoreductase [Ideonella sp. BN130291]|uniref:NAD(P)/FAD-dependent oxidoreductase n=1 Tax=Ideonella sp. BN130291 TaxID=3112940 RepID=UPI002E26F03E|nr:NAD(P)/FAD-dependent oxidoreductase [Ideonella sp. BN130291]